MSDQPFSPACERNKDPIIAQLGKFITAPARVLEIGEIDPEGYSVNIKLDIGVPLVATITRKSLAHLDLKPGQEVFAHIKAVKMVQDMDEF